jgi:hypothetical protein
MGRELVKRSTGESLGRVTASPPKRASIAPDSTVSRIVTATRRSTWSPVRCP